MRYISHNGIEGGFWVASPRVIQHGDGGGRSHRDVVGAKANEGSIALVQAEVVLVGRSGSNQQEAVQVSDFGQDWAWDGAKIGTKERKEDEMVQEIQDEGDADGHQEWERRETSRGLNSVHFCSSFIPRMSNGTHFVLGGHRYLFNPASFSALRLSSSSKIPLNLFCAP